MPRNTRGKPVKSERRDRLKTEIKREGIAHKPDEMKSEDQGGGGGRTEAGHVTEKKAGPYYGRKRH